ncbi:MAG: hypothetical protein ACREAC_33090, partial [Blastocatellia bacterium]
MEAELGEEKPVFFEASEDGWEKQPIPDGPMTLGIDGALFEPPISLVSSKSSSARASSRSNEEEQTPSSKCFSFVQTFDENRRRRPWEVISRKAWQK